MIFVAGTLTVNPAVVADFQRDVAAMVDKIRSEDGCHHYSLLVENAATGLINVLEQWEDDSALVVHLRQPWITAFFARYVEHLRASTVRVFDITGERPLPPMA
jgi:quinol monooxygenase YgiN